MHQPTRRRLLALNRNFYATVAEPFHETRRSWTPGKMRLLSYLPMIGFGPTPTVVDVGCGNGRLAVMLESLARPCAYTGVDGSRDLLELARRQTAALTHVRTQFFEADLAQANWTHALGEPPRPFDLVVCLATLQHLPGRDLRLAVMRALATLVAPGGLLVVSAWQFLTSPRFVAKQIDWEVVGVEKGHVEPGDALLPWRQGAYAIRYVHQIDEAEMDELAVAAGLRVRERYHADGREGNLNLYAIMQLERAGNEREDAKRT